MHSGISQHHQACAHEFDPKNASVIATVQGKSKRKIVYDLKIREALEIRRQKCGPGRGLNEDMGAYVKIDIWDPVLHTMDRPFWVGWATIGVGEVQPFLGSKSLSFIPSLSHPHPFVPLYFNFPLCLLSLYNTSFLSLLILATEDGLYKLNQNICQKSSFFCSQYRSSP
mgnify:CR=1 FL=1